MSDAAGDSEGTGRVGMALAQERARQGLPLEAIAERTRIPLRHLLTIESGGHEGLPAVPYSAGFVKAYAQALGLDGVDYSRRFREEAGAIEPHPRPTEPYEPVDPARVPSRLIAIVAVAVALLLVGGYYLWRSRPSHDDVMRTAAAVDPAPAGVAPAASQPLGGPSAPSSAAMPAAAGGPVAIVAQRPVWLKVYEKGGRTLFMGVLDAGKRYDVPADAADPRIQTGRADGLTVTVGGRAIPPLGPEAQVIKDVSLAPAALLARIVSPAPPASSTPPVPR